MDKALLRAQINYIVLNDGIKLRIQILYENITWNYTYTSSAHLNHFGCKIVLVNVHVSRNHGICYTERMPVRITGEFTGNECRGITGVKMELECVVMYPSENQSHKGHLTSKLKYRRFLSYLFCIFLVYPFHLLPFPVHPAGFSTCFFSVFLVIFSLLSSNNNNKVRFG